MVVDLCWIYGVVIVDLVVDELDVFEEKWVGKYFFIVFVWCWVWVEVILFFVFDLVICKIVYIMNVIESLNWVICKLIKICGLFLIEEVVIKLIYLVV